MEHNSYSNASLKVQNHFKIHTQDDLKRKIVKKQNKYSARNAYLNHDVSNPVIFRVLSFYTQFITCYILAISKSCTHI